MINANECRVNNRFIRELRNTRGLEYDHEFVLTPEWMGKLFGHDLNIALIDLFPIPLTPEILEKAGLEKVDNSSQHSIIWKKSLVGFSSTMKLYESGGEYCFSPFEWNYTLKVKYLHQLQNLYYALTGTELSITIQ